MFAYHPQHGIICRNCDNNKRNMTLLIKYLIIHKCVHALWFIKLNANVSLQIEKKKPQSNLIWCANDLDKTCSFKW